MDPLKAPSAPETKLHFLDYWRIIRIRKTVIIAVFLLVAITATFVTFFLPVSYSSKATIKIERESTDVPSVTGQPSVSGIYDPYFIQTEFEVIQSPLEGEIQHTAPAPVATADSPVETAAAAAAAAAAAPVVAAAPVASAPAPAEATEQPATQNSIVKVDTAKLDSLLDLVGEMVIAQSLVSQDLGSDGPVFVADSKLKTYGARWNRGMMTGDKLNMFDWNIEYAMQNGDEGGPAGGPETKIKAWIGEGWFAYNFNAGSTHGRVHIGTLMTSGDKNTTTDDEEFFTLYGDFHANNRFGDLDWVDQFGPSNTTDYNIGYEHWIGADHYVMIAYHMFKETESNGATEDKIGDEIDLKYGYKYSKNLSFEVLLGQASPNDTFFGFATDPVQRASVQAKLGW